MAKGLVKKIARKAWKVTKRLTGNRYGRGYSQILSKGVPQMVKDISYLKSVINSEKLRITVHNASPVPVSQVNANANGYYILDITPVPAQGDGVSNRTGSSLKLHSSSINLQLYQQSAAISPMKFKIFIIKVNGNPDLLTNVVGQFLVANPFNTATDYNSNRNPDFMKNFRVLRVIKTSLAPDNLTSAVSMRELRIGLKYKNHHVRYDRNTTTVTNGQIVMLITVDSGNQSTTTASTLNVPVQATNTGALVNWFYDHYYYDN